MNRVLVVDSNADSRLLLGDFLTIKGYEVSAVASGRQALRSLDQLAPQVVVLDLQMPDIDGFATLARLRETDPALPVIALSAHVLPDDERQVQAAGFDAALSKPLDLVALLDTVRLLISRHREATP